MLELKKITKRFAKKNVLDDLSYTFDEGKIYCIIGENGIGKTTLLNCLSNRIDYTGEITMNGCQFNVGYVTAPPILPSFLTSEELIEFALGKDKIHLLDYLNIKKEDQIKIIKNCSLGTMNKVQFLIAINSFDKVLLLDEPFVNLDHDSRKKCIKMLSEKKDNNIIIICTHDYELIDDICDNILKLDGHKLLPINKKDLK